MVTKTKKPDDKRPPNLLETAYSLADTFTDNREAVDALLKWIEKNPSALTNDLHHVCRLLISEARTKVNSVLHGKRNRLPKGMGKVPSSKINHKAALEAMRKTSMTGTLLCQSIGRIPMGDCTKADLLASAEADEASGAGTMTLMLWKRYIAAGLRGNQKVSSKYNDEDLRKLLIKSEKESKRKFAAK